MYALGRWLQLKEPFRTEAIERKVWNEVKNEKKMIGPGLVLAIWAIDDPADAKLQNLALRRVVNDTEKEDDPEKVYHALCQAFESNERVLYAFVAEVEKRKGMADRAAILAARGQNNNGGIN